MKSMWDSATHKMAIISESHNGKNFIKFINMMMNDTTFLLDESLDALKRIHDVQVRDVTGEFCLIFSSPGRHERPGQVGQSEPGAADQPGQAAVSGRETVPVLPDPGPRDCGHVPLPHSGHTPALPQAGAGGQTGRHAGPCPGPADQRTKVQVSLLTGFY